MRRDKNVPDNGEYRPKRWSRQWKIINLKRSEKKEEREARVKRKSEPYEKIRNGEKQIELRAKMEKNGEKGKRARTWTKKHKARPERQGEEMAGLVHESE